MKTFTDSAGRQWTPRLDDEAITAGRVETRICLATMRSQQRPNLPGGADWHAFMALLWAACHPQAIQAGIDRDNFAGALRSDAVITSAVDAFVDALIEHGPEGTKVQMRESWLRVALTAIPKTQ